jgi:tetratricopeptide (TPR) repeat protein
LKGAEEELFELKPADKVKALYRRGLARASLGEASAAEEGFKQALELAPNDALIKNEIARLAKKKEAELAKQRAAFSKMFGWSDRQMGMGLVDRDEVDMDGSTAEDASGIASRGRMQWHQGWQRAILVWRDQEEDGMDRHVRRHTSSRDAG